MIKKRKPVNCGDRLTETGKSVASHLYKRLDNAIDKNGRVHLSRTEVNLVYGIIDELDF
jgi:hypothetical protein